MVYDHGLTSREQAIVKLPGNFCLEDYYLTHDPKQFVILVKHAGII